MKKIILVMIAGALPFSVLADDGLPDRPFVEVNGEGTVSAPPSYLKVNFTVTSIAQNNADAKRAVDEKLLELGKILREQKIPSDAMESYRFSISEEHEYVGGEYKLVGHRAKRDVTLTIRDLSRAQEIIDALTDAPIEMWRHIEAYTDDMDALLEKAQIEALKSARRRAEVYAHAEGRKVGGVYRIGDDVIWDDRFDSDVAMLAERTAPAEDGLPIFQVGEIEVIQQVRVIYLLD